MALSARDTQLSKEWLKDYGYICGSDGYPTLYKYRSLERDPNREHDDHFYTMRLLEDGEICFANPTEYEDENDCRPKYSCRGTRTEKMKAYRQFLKRNGLSRARERAARFFRRLGRKGLAKWEREREADFWRLLGRARVFCMCEVNDSLSVWRGYAGDGNGICVELKATLAPPQDYEQGGFFGHCYRVHYQDEVGTVNPYRQSPLENACQAFLAKTREWEHEEEWRIVDFWDSRAVRPLQEGLISRLIVGYNVSEEDRSVIRELMGKVRPDVPTAYARRLADGETIVIEDEVGSGVSSS